MSKPMRESIPDSESSRCKGSGAGLCLTVGGLAGRPEPVRGEQWEWRSVRRCAERVHSRARQPDFESQLCHVLAVWCRASHLPSLCLSSFIC